MIDQATIDRILDAAQIMDVVSDFVTLRKRGVNYVGCVLFITTRLLLFMSLPPKGFANVSHVEKGEMPYTSSWSTSRCPIRKH